MKILYTDCVLGMTERALFTGLLDLGLSPTLLEKSLIQLNFNADGVVAHLRQSTCKNLLQSALDLRPATLPMQDALDRLGSSSLAPDICETSRRILFRSVCKAETESTDRVLLPVEGIVLVVGILQGLKQLDIGKVYSSPLPVPISSTDGKLLKILLAGSVPIREPTSTSLLTPVGAAFLAEVATFTQPNLILTGLGQAVIQTETCQEVVLRLLMGEEASPFADTMSLLQTDLDDITPQILTYVIERLNLLGALEVYQIPIGVKKNRMAYQLNVIARHQDEKELANIILKETTTLGLRVIHIDDHYTAQFMVRNVFTPFGEIPMKYKLLDNKVIGIQPEYDVCAQAAANHNVPLQQVVASAQAVANRLDGIIGIYRG